MTFTWTGLVDTDLQKVRALVQDTDSTDPLQTDEEINFQLAQFPNIFRAAAGVADQISAKLGRRLDRSVLGASDSPSRAAEFYTNLAEKLRSAANGRCTIFIGGLTRSGKRDLAQNTDAIQPSFAIGVDDYAPSPQQDSVIGRYRDP